MALVHLMWVVGYDQAKPEDGLRWAKLVSPLVDAVNDDGELFVRLHNAMGAVRLQQGDYDGRHRRSSAPSK